jgi:hypothetical protein
VSQFHRPRQAVAAALPAPPQGLDLVLREHEQILPHGIFLSSPFYA